MAEKKNQHYIPKFYLKIFSNNKDKKSIGVWHVEGEKYIKSGSIKSQASEAYFYGKDLELENAFGDFEGYIALLIKHLIENESPPQYYSVAHQDLLAFIIILNKRTKFAADELNEGTDKMMKSVLKHDAKLKNHLEGFTIKSSNAPLESLGLAMMSHPVTVDLKFKLLKNNTEIPFIISDNPVILFNQFLQSRNWIGGRNGLAQTGLQIFFPTSPHHMLVFYDGSLYKCGNKKEKTVILKDKNDVNEFNALQLINSNEAIYFNERISETYLRNLSFSNKKYRNKNKIDLKELKKIGGDPDDMNYMMWISSPHIKKTLKVNSFKMLKKSKKKELDPSMSQLRNPKAIEDHQKFVDQMMEKIK